MKRFYKALFIIFTIALLASCSTTTSTIDTPSPEGVQIEVMVVEEASTEASESVETEAIVIPETTELPEVVDTPVIPEVPTQSAEVVEVPNEAELVAEAIEVFEEAKEALEELGADEAVEVIEKAEADVVDAIAEVVEPVQKEEATETEEPIQKEEATETVEPVQKVEETVEVEPIEKQETTVVVEPIVEDKVEVDVPAIEDKTETVEEVAPVVPTEAAVMPISIKINTEDDPVGSVDEAVVTDVADEAVEAVKTDEAVNEAVGSIEAVATDEAIEAVKTDEAVESVITDVAVDVVMTDSVDELDEVEYETETTVGGVEEPAEIVVGKEVYPQSFEDLINMKEEIPLWIYIGAGLLILIIFLIAILIISSKRRKHREYLQNKRDDEEIYGYKAEKELTAPEVQEEVKVEEQTEPKKKVVFNPYDQEDGSEGLEVRIDLEIKDAWVSGKVDFKGEATENLSVEEAVEFGEDDVENVRVVAGLIKKVEQQVVEVYSKQLCLKYSFIKWHYKVLCNVGLRDFIKAAYVLKNFSSDVNRFYAEYEKVSSTLDEFDFSFFEIGER